MKVKKLESVGIEDVFDMTFDVKFERDPSRQDLILPALDKKPISANILFKGEEVKFKIYPMGFNEIREKMSQAMKVDSLLMYGQIKIPRGIYRFNWEGAVLTRRSLRVVPLEKLQLFKPIKIVDISSPGWTRRIVFDEENRPLYFRRLAMKWCERNLGDNLELSERPNLFDPIAVLEYLKREMKGEKEKEEGKRNIIEFMGDMLNTNPDELLISYSSGW